MRHTSIATRPVQRGFTLVELLMVIAILGVLAGLAVFGVNAGRRAIMRQAIAMEVSQLNQAVEAYKTKYGEYPPDGTSLAAFKTHFQSVFPNLHPHELRIFDTTVSRISNANVPDGSGVMDPAEAMVFCLGGFSNDPKFPFTGPGGPVHLEYPSGTKITSDVVDPYSGNYRDVIKQYNVDRNAAFYDFGQDRLSIEIVGNVTKSYDDVQFGTGAENDFFPVYVPKSRKVPIVYFSASTYSFQVGQNVYYNNYAVAGSSAAGVARPYKSDQVNTTAATQDRKYRYMNEKSFQIISAGLDDNFGGTTDFWPSPSNTPVFFQYPTGKGLDIVSGQTNTTGYRNPNSGDGPSAQLDNVTNFSEGTLEAALP